MNNFKANKLPYDMGNAGDLIKHGVLAEYAQWWSKIFGDMIFIDPFGGRPWQEPINLEVSNRLLQLSEQALTDSQLAPKLCYYGSAFVVKNAVNNLGKVDILVSDRDEDALSDLLSVGFEQFTAAEFTKDNGFSILDCQNLSQDTSLILLDPFDDFIDIAEEQFKKISNFMESTKIPILIYILADQGREIYFSDIKKKYLGGKINSLSLTCPIIPNSSVKGESKYTSEILLILPKNRFDNSLKLLEDRLIKLAESLTHILNVKIIFNT